MLHPFLLPLLQEMSIPFINAMAQAMYSEEARQTSTLELLTSEEIMDLHISYLAFPQ